MDIVHGCSGVTYPYLMKHDFFSLRILHENSLRLPFYFQFVIIWGFQYFAFFPRVMKVSCQSSCPKFLAAIDLFRLYILFSQYRSCDDTQEIWSFVLFIKKSIFMLACTLFNEQDKESNLLSEYHHMICIGKTKCTSEKGLLFNINSSQLALFTTRL